MTLRRTLWALPLAVTVAVLAHLVTFGFAHAPGGVHAWALLSALGATLAFGSIAAFAGGFAGVPATRRRAGFDGRSALVLAAAGAAAFGVIELSEGHLAFPAFLVAALAALPLAGGVLVTARSADRAARHAGALFASVLRGSPARRIGKGTASLGPRRRLALASGCLFLASLRGRAPPISL